MNTKGKVVYLAKYVLDLSSIVLVKTAGLLLGWNLMLGSGSITPAQALGMVLVFNVLGSVWTKSSSYLGELVEEFIELLPRKEKQ